MIYGIHKKNIRSKPPEKQTPEEAIVWELLRNRRFMNLKFRRQHDIEGFIVDFYCHELKLAVEIDGGIHDKQKEYDELRQELIASNGIRFVRVTNDEVNRDFYLVLERIECFVE